MASLGNITWEVQKPEDKLYNLLLIVGFSTTFLTSIWIWLYVISGLILKLVVISRKVLVFVRNSLDITNEPFRAMGFTLLLLVSIAYLVWGVVLMVG